MAEQINQDITIPDDPPSSRDKVNFRLRADAFVAWMKVFATQVKSFIPQFNQALVWIADKEASTVNASAIAVASANFKGTWSAPASVKANESYVYNGIFYRALQDSIGQTPPDSSANYQNSYWVGYGATLNYIQQQISQQADVLKDVPQNAQSAAYILALSDRGKSIDVSTGGITVTVPLNSTVAFPIGSTVTITNLATTAITIASSATLKQAGTTNTGNRTLAGNGMATLRKVAADTWFIGGAGVS